MNRGLLPALMLILLCTACAPAAQETGGYQLYFAAGTSRERGPAVDTQPGPWTQEEVPSPRQMIEALLAGPEEGDLRSPFPKSLTLREIVLGADGVVRVNFSESYGGLTDIDLTLADYCVVLTLNQLEGVVGVEITSAGQTIAYRSHQRLSAGEVVLPSPRDVGDGDEISAQPP